MIVFVSQAYIKTETLHKAAPLDMLYADEEDRCLGDRLGTEWLDKRMHLEMQKKKEQAVPSGNSTSYDLR